MWAFEVNAVLGRCLVIAAARHEGGNHNGKVAACA